MKTLKLIFEFFSKNILKALIVVLVFTVVLYFFNMNIAIYRYTAYSLEMFENAETKDSLYCMPNFNESELMSTSAFDPTAEAIDKIEEQAKKYKAYTPFKRSINLTTNFNGSQLNNFVFSKETAEECNIKLSEGSWDDFIKEGKYINAIVSGKRFDNLKIGDVVDVSFYTHEASLTGPANIKIRIAGRLAYPYVVPNYGVKGNVISSIQIYQPFEGMIFPKNKQFYDTLTSKSADSGLATQNNFMTAYKSGASESEKQEYLEFLKSNLGVATYEEIHENSIGEVNRTLKTKLPTPMFLLVITALSLISISVLLVNKKQREYSTYYLCGCNRRKSYFIISCAITLMSVFGVAVNAVLIANSYYLVPLGMLTTNNNGVVYDEKSLLLMLACALGISLIAVLVSILTFRKTSPIEFYRDN